MKYFCVSDIHGFYNELIEALKEKGFDENDSEHKLIIIGDIFDRGSQAKELLDYLLKLKSDVISKITSYGPHRDDLFFYINGNKANLCSQGQQRTICLSLKIALYEYIKRHTKQEPIILLDDVLSELDDIRQKKLIGIIKNTQSFITTTNIDVIKNMLSDCQIFMLKENEIKELN